MKTFTDTARHGEVYLRRIDALPEQHGEEVAPDGNGNVVVAHSESGHHHYFAAQKAKVFRVNALLAYAILQKGAELKHAKEGPEKHDTEILTKGGVFEIRNKREWTPWGDRLVAD